MRGLRFAYCALPLFVCQSALHAQETQRAVEPPATAYDTLLHRNLASVMFDRDLSTYNWTGRLLLDTTIAGNALIVNEQFISNIIEVTPTPFSPKGKLISDQQNVSVGVSRPLDDEITGRGRWSSLTYSDNKAVGLSNATSNALLGGFSYAPSPNFSLTPMAGYRWERQSDIADRGPSLDFGAGAYIPDLGGYRFTGAAQYHKDLLDPRTLENHFIHGGVQRYFTGLTRDSLELGFSRNRREFYTLADSSIESRLEDNVSFANLIDYEVVDRFITSFFFGISSLGLDESFRSPVILSPQNFQFNTRITEFHLDTYLQAAYRSPDAQTSASIRMLHSERDERHAAEPSPEAPSGFFFDQSNKLEHEKDNLTRRTSLDGALSFPLTGSDHATLSGAVSILHYDTPSEDNHEDRDEQLVVASLSTTHHISRFLDFAVSLDGTVSHLVYLLSDRSGNNNYNRVLRLAPRAIYRPSAAVCSVNAFEVLANYTVYDFELQQAQIRSFTYRQFGWLDSSSVELTHRIGIDVFVYWKLYERGQLSWSDFSERRESSSVDKTYAAQMRFSPGPGTMFAVGVRYFSQTRYAYAGAASSLDSFLSNLGPTCTLLWQMGPHSQCALRGWYEQRKQEGGSLRPLASMTLNILVNI